MRHFSQEYLALEMGLSQPTISKIESDGQRISYAMLKQIALIFKVDVNEIINIDNKTMINTFSGKNSGFQNHYEDGVDQVKVLYEGIIRDKDKEIEFLRELVNKMK